MFDKQRKNKIFFGNCRMKKNKEISIDKKVLAAEKTITKTYKISDKLEYLSDIIENYYNTDISFSNNELKEKYHKDLIYLKHKSNKKIKRIKSKYWNYRKKADKLKSQLKMRCRHCGIHYVDFICYSNKLCNDCQNELLEFIDE